MALPSISVLNDFSILKFIDDIIGPGDYFIAMYMTFPVPYSQLKSATTESVTWQTACTYTDCQPPMK